MDTGSFLFISAGDILLSAIGITWWLELLIIGFVLLIGYFIFRSRLNALKHINSDLERQLLERSELLAYSRKNEQKAREIAELANTNKSQLLTKISHEIRTPMNGVMGMASLLNETTLNTEQQEYVGSILYSGDSLLSTINTILMEDVLEYSKIESGKELQLKDFDIRNTIEEVLDVFAAKAAQSDIDLLCDIDKNVPPQVVSDSMRLRQVLMNILENAVKFTRKGEIFVGVHLAEQTDDNKVKLEFEIKDTGEGMSAAKVDELNRDLSVKNKVLDNSGAAGVGLLVSKNLVALMGGAIKVESVVNEGSTFRFTIIAGISLQSLRSAVVNDMAGLEGKKILLVDDNSHTRTLLKSQLERWPLLISAVGSAKAALEVLAQNPSFDMLITDQQMPEMNGLQLAQEIRKFNSEVPLILLSKAGDEEFKQHTGLFSSVLPKPVHLQALVEQITAGLRQKGKATEPNSTRKLSADFAKEYPLSILIAEDNAMNQKLVTKVLNKLGYEPHITNNGKEVLEEITQKHYDVILMDVQMPEMDGLEATRMIRLCLNNQPVIIAMTANTLQGDREECLRSGMDDYISKPVKLEELVGILEKWALHSLRA